ncbi:MAG: Xaa-Pro peptidase family protein [Rhodobacteraceae bacterium]|jgi:Xaa-Pro aminopeptidase|nr:Xaa-Pro peptidase family protein [Paracoccaceae bacterium]
MDRTDMTERDFPREEFERRWTRAQELMARDGLDALFVTEKTNYRYFTGHQTLQFNNKQRPMTVLIPREGQPVMMIYGLEAEVARNETWVADVRGYVDVPFPVSLVTDTQNDLGLSGGRIGCELGDNQRLWMSHRDFEAIRAALPGARFVDASETLVACRIVKSQLEIERIETACRLTEEAWTLVQQRVRPGMSVRDAERICFEALVEAGSDPSGPGFVLLDVLGFGTGHRYAAGDLFFCDFGGTFGGYRADFARMATFGPASAELRQAHSDICGIIDAVIGAMRPGVTCRDIAETCNRELQKLGLPRLQGSKRIGHGCGIEFQEPPSLNAVDLTVLQPGMVLTPEPRFVRDGRFIMVEEDVVITETGARRLSHGCERLYEIGL